MEAQGVYTKHRKKDEPLSLRPGPVSREPCQDTLWNIFAHLCRVLSVQRAHNRLPGPYFLMCQFSNFALRWKLEIHTQQRTKNFKLASKLRSDSGSKS